MENSLPAQGGGLGVSSQGADGINNNFKIVKQVQAEHKPSLKKLAPETKSVKEMGANFDMGSEIGMTKVNSAESTKIQAAPEIGRGGLVDEVF
jgi:hypothetical protein|tara:strand:+ start:190 stop:468 length:279 start_codon:yes stop_codon:yes gene_type:complete